VRPSLQPRSEGRVVSGLGFPLRARAQGVWADCNASMRHSLSSLRDRTGGCVEKKSVGVGYCTRAEWRSRRNLVWFALQK
jgi:hypothetical protein